MASNLGSPVRADAEGRFEIKGAAAGPPVQRHHLRQGLWPGAAECAGFGHPTNRVELEPFQLMPADQRIAGVVLDEDDKPVARASIYSYGDKQPNLNAQTDAKGQFSLDKVCAGADPAFGQ